MIVVSPVTVTDAVLTSSNAPETDYAEWLAATTYSVGDKVIRLTTHRIYENLIAGVNATLPENALTGATPRWLDIGATNRWAMFDDEINSNTTLAGTLTVVLAPGSIDTVSLIDITADSATVVLRDSPGGTILYDVTRTDLDASPIVDIFGWFIAPYQQKTILNFTDMPVSYTDCELTITLTGTVVSCGACKFGTSINIGDAQFGVEVGITDYSRKTTNEFGRVLIVPRESAKPMNVKLEIQNGVISSVYNLLEGLKTTACVWIGQTADVRLEDMLTVYGFYEDFSVVVPYPSMSHCNLSIQGLI